MTTANGSDGLLRRKFTDGQCVAIYLMSHTIDGAPRWAHLSVHGLRKTSRQYAPMIFLPFLLPILIFGTIALYIFFLMNIITRISNAIDRRMP